MSCWQVVALFAKSPSLFGKGLIHLRQYPVRADRYSGGAPYENYLSHLIDASLNRVWSLLPPALLLFRMKRPELDPSLIYSKFGGSFILNTPSILEHFESLIKPSSLFISLEQSQTKKQFNNNYNLYFFKTQE